MMKHDDQEDINRLVAEQIAKVIEGGEADFHKMMTDIMLELREIAIDINLKPFGLDKRSKIRKMCDIIEDEKKTRAHGYIKGLLEPELFEPKKKKVRKKLEPGQHWTLLNKRKKWYMK